MGKKSWENTTRPYVKEAVVFTEFLSKINKNLLTMEVSDLDRFIFERKHLSTLKHSATTGIKVNGGETFETNWPIDFRKNVSVVSASGTPAIHGVIWGITSG